MKKLSGLILSIVLCACHSETKAPLGILPDTTMRSILMDLSVVDASQQVSATSLEAPKFKSELFYEQIMKDHQTSREQFNRSMAYYSQNTKVLQKIYDDALIELSKQQINKINK